MGQWAMVSTTKMDSLSFISGTHMMEEENWFLVPESCLLTSKLDAVACSHT